MPSKPQTFCINGCKDKAEAGHALCVICRKRTEEDRGTPASRGYDAQWSRVSRMVRMAEPICRACKKNLAQMVDHIKPLRQGGDRLAVENLQPLCNRCHASKTARDRAVYGG